MIGSLINQVKPDAIEIHTAPGREQKFKSIIKTIQKAENSFKRI